MSGLTRKKKSADHEEFRNVVDDAAWSSLSKLMTLPDKARGELGWIVFGERLEFEDGKSRSSHSKWSSGFRKRQKKLNKMIARFADALDDPEAKTNLWYTLVIGHGQSLLTTSPDYAKSEIGKIQGTIHEWQVRFARAGKAGSQRRSTPGKPTRLRELISQLDRLLICHTGKGLVRASEHSKTPKGRASDSLKFVREVVTEIFGPIQRIADSTIDGGMRDVIRKRHVGST